MTAPARCTSCGGLRRPSSARGSRCAPCWGQAAAAAARGVLVATCNPRYAIPAYAEALAALRDLGPVHPEVMT